MNRICEIKFKEIFYYVLWMNFFVHLKQLQKEIKVKKNELKVVSSYHLAVDLFHEKFWRIHVDLLIMNGIEATRQSKKSSYHFPTFHQTPINA